MVNEEKKKEAAIFDLDKRLDSYTSHGPSKLEDVMKEYDSFHENDLNEMIHHIDDISFKAYTSFSNALAPDITKDGKIDLDKEVSTIEDKVLAALGESIETKFKTLSPNYLKLVENIDDKKEKANTLIKLYKEFTLGKVDYHEMISELKQKSGNVGDLYKEFKSLGELETKVLPQKFMAKIQDKIFRDVGKHHLYDFIHNTAKTNYHGTEHAKVATQDIQTMYHVAHQVHKNKFDKKWAKEHGLNYESLKK